MVIVYNKYFLKAILTGIIVLGALWLIGTSGLKMPEWVAFLPFAGAVAYDLWLRTNTSRNLESRMCFICPSTGAHLLYIPIWILLSIVAFTFILQSGPEIGFYLFLGCFLVCPAMAILDTCLLRGFQRQQGEQRDIFAPSGIRDSRRRSGDGRDHYVAMLAKVANLDGTITKAEIAVISGLFDQVFHTDEEKHWALRRVWELKESNLSFEEHARRFFWVHYENKEMLLFALDSIFFVSMADGRMSAEERRLLQTAMDGFGLCSPAFDSYKTKEKPTASESLRDSAYYARALGIEGSVTKEEVRAQYKRLAAQYHPDKVAHLGDRLRAVADEEMKNINEAYDFFRKTYGL